MNRIVTTFFPAILLFCLCSCGDKPYPRLMQRADSIVAEYPDSAFTLLKQIGKGIYTEPKSTRMYYYLLYTKAKDKAYIPHTTDKLMQIALHYYEKKKDRKHLPEAYYYTGRIYRDAGDSPQALAYFEKALDASGGSTDYKATSLICSGVGTLYLFQNVYEAAMDAFRKAYDYNLLAKDSVRIVYNLRDIGDAFTALNKADSALYYYKRAYGQAVRVKNKHLMDVTQYGLASLYIQLHEYHKAKEALQFTSKALQRGYVSSVYSISAKLCYQSGKIDSASYYYKRLLDVGTIYAKQAAHWGLSEIAQKQGDCGTALEQLRQYNACADSIRKITNTETIRRMQSLYNYQLREKENNRLKDENARVKQSIAYIFIAFIFLAAGITIYILYNKHKKLQWKIQLDKLERLREEQYQRSNQFIEENKKKIRTLEKALQASKAEKDKLQHDLLLVWKEQIEQTNARIATRRKEEELSTMKLKQSEIYTLFRKAAHDTAIKITENEWHALQEAVDNTYNNFTKRLNALYPASQTEERICLLIKIAVPPTGIARLVSLSKQGVTSARKRLYEKIHGESGTPEALDDLIRGF